MEDKNIKNGVDVSGCLFCKDGWRCTAETVWSDNCNSVPNCIYKLKMLLKERRKEIYKLKKTIDDIKEVVLGVRNYLNCPSPKDVRYEMDIILQKISEVENG